MKYKVSFTRVRRHSSAPTTRAQQSDICAYGESYPEGEEFADINDAEAYALKEWQWMERIDRYNCVATIESAEDDNWFSETLDFWKEHER